LTSEAVYEVDKNLKHYETSSGNLYLPVLFLSE